ncbi:tail fiber domain-containing protein [Pseudescherichia vulneris]
MATGVITDGGTRPWSSQYFFSAVFNGGTTQMGQPLTGGSAGSGNTLTGTGTNFAAAGSLIRNGCTVIVMTSLEQVFQITGVNSATQLAVTPAVNPAIPAGTRYSILLSDSLSLDGLAQDIAETSGMYQRYMSGFADVMTGTGNVTITINGISVTVPAQKSLAQKGANGAVPIASGGSGAMNAADALTNLGALPAAGAFFIGTSMGANDKSLMIGHTTSEGLLSSAVSFNRSGNIVANNGQFVSASDERIKRDIKRGEDPLDKMRAIKGVMYYRRDNNIFSIGFIAQDVQ